MKPDDCNPLVSAIIPVHNCERYLGEAIQSVLDQTYRPLEIIVVDNGSTDGSRAVAESFGSSLRYIWQPDRGPAGGRNTGVNAAEGMFFAFLDSDDLWVHDKLALQMAAFIDNPQLDAIFGHVEQFLTPELSADLRGHIRCPDHPMPGYVAPAMLIRRDSFFLVGELDEKWKVGTFEDWYSRAVDEKLNMLMLDAVVMRRRLHDKNMGVVDREGRKDYLRVLKAALDRRRRSNQG